MTEISIKLNIPDGYTFDRIGLPKRGEHYLLSWADTLESGITASKVHKADINFQSDVYVIVKKWQFPFWIKKNIWLYCYKDGEWFLSPNEPYERDNGYFVAPAGTLVKDFPYRYLDIVMPSKGCFYNGID